MWDLKLRATLVGTPSQKLSTLTSLCCTLCMNSSCSCFRSAESVFVFFFVQVECCCFLLLVATGSRDVTDTTERRTTCRELQHLLGGRKEQGSIPGSVHQSGASVRYAVENHAPQLQT